MLRSTQSLPVIILLTFLTGCATSMQVQSSHNSSADFSNLKTYQWGKVAPLDVDKSRVDVSEVDARIRRTVDNELAAKGFKKVSSGGDFLVTYHAALDTKVDITQQDVYAADGMTSDAAWMGTEEVKTVIDKGSLVLDIVDPSSKKVIWRTSASKTVELDVSPAKKDARAKEAVQQMLANFPPQ